MSEHDDSISFALSKSLRNVLSSAASDAVVPLDTRAHKTFAPPRVTDLRHVILDGYVPRL